MNDTVDTPQRRFAPLLLAAAALLAGQARADDAALGKTIATQGTTTGVAACIGCHGRRRQRGGRLPAPRGHPCRLSVRAACRVRGRQPPEPGHAATLDTADAARATRSPRTSRACPRRPASWPPTTRRSTRRTPARGSRRADAGRRACPRARNATAPAASGGHRVSAARGPAGRLYRRPAERLETRHAPARANGADAGDRRQAV